jgi:hypothetical protein
MATAIPNGPERLLDGKTFTFNQYVGVLFPEGISIGESVTIGFNVSANGYEY